MTQRPPHLCPYCKAVFTNTLLMGEHRTGSPRRCMTPDELRDHGLRQRRDGQWTRGPV